MELKAKLFIYMCIFSLVLTLVAGTGYFFLIRQRAQQSMITGLYALGEPSNVSSVEQSVKAMCASVPFVKRYYFEHEFQNSDLFQLQTSSLFNNRIAIHLRKSARFIVVEFYTLGAFMRSAHNIFLLSLLLLFNLIVSSIAYAGVSYYLLTPLEEMRRVIRSSVACRATHGVSFFDRDGFMGNLGKQLNQLLYELDQRRSEPNPAADSAADKRNGEDHSTSIAQRLSATGRLAAGIAHEINNPLGGMINAARTLLRNESHSQKTKEYLELIMDGLMRIQDTIRKIHHFKFSNTRNTYHPVSIKESLMRSVGFIDHVLQEKNITITTDIPDGLPHILGNYGDLQQVFLNILKNAVEAVDNYGAVTVKASHVKSNVEIVIADNGCGMTKEEIEQAFDLFFTTKSSMRGSGLGMAIVHNIIKHHGGSLAISSVKGLGSDITITLPVHERIVAR